MEIGSARRLGMFVARRRAYLTWQVEQSIKKRPRAKQEEHQKKYEDRHTALLEAWRDYWQTAETLRVSSKVL